MKKIEFHFAMFLYGFGLYELFGKMSLNLEQSNRPLDGVYFLFVCASFFGVLVAARSLIRIYKIMAKSET